MVVLYGSDISSHQVHLQGCNSMRREPTALMRGGPVFSCPVLNTLISNFLALRFSREVFPVHERLAKMATKEEAKAFIMKVYTTNPIHQDDGQLTNGRCGSQSGNQVLRLYLSSSMKMQRYQDILLQNKQHGHP